MEQGQRISHGALLSESPVGGTRLGYYFSALYPSKYCGHHIMLRASWSFYKPLLLSTADLMRCYQ